LPVLAEAALTVERVCKDPAPGAHLMRFGADGLELRVSFWIADPQNGKTGVLSDVNRALWAVMKERGIEFHFRSELFILQRKRP
jgi:small-conductance mechanosensitive channel